ncbi:aspartyl-phosphate phosphatase Spo0E family protein [Clostridium sporogenes]|nr:MULTISPECIES: aspartyl-phosphate phosphatase Spo0E family protein [Clostridium]MCW6110980.1 aspartyl-phosphate phosphatase Spo0E family protein [Clostridium sporogenes]
MVIKCIIGYVFYKKCIGMVRMMGKVLEQTRERLNNLIEMDSILYEGEILKLSQELDKLIYKYYKHELIN